MLTTELKTALLLSPHLLAQGKSPFEILYIEKTNKGIRLQHEAISQTQLQQKFGILPQPGQRALLAFEEKALEIQKSTIRENYKLQKSGKDYEKYYAQSYFRYLHELVSSIKPFFPYIKLYQQVLDPVIKKNLKTTPCNFSSYTPRLRFTVVKNATGHFKVECVVEINQAIYLLNDFNQYHFLIESRGEYFLLSHKDFRTLEWLQTLDWKKEGAEADYFTQHIIAKLEENYVVDRNGLLNRTKVEATPICRVLLSEINEAFLVLTPQFDYDGFIVEAPYKETHILHNNGNEYELIRNKTIETDFAQILESFHPNFSRQLNGYFYLPFAEAQKKQWFVKVYQQLMEQNVELAGMSMLKHFRYCPDPPTTNLTFVKEDSNNLVFSFQLKFGKEIISPNELQKVLRSGQQLVLLKDGSIGLLDEHWLKQYATLIKHSTIGKKEITVPKWLLLTEEAAIPEQKQHLQKAISNNWYNKWDQWQQQGTAVYALPNAVNAELRPYQYKGYEWMQLLTELGAGACLADDMGLGKTLQTICFLASQLEKFPTLKALIVCPASLIYNWQNEWQKFAPSITCYVYHGSGRNKEIFKDDTLQVVISSYGTVRSEEELFTTIPFSTIVLDESHTIKNPSAQVTKVVQQLQSKTRIALSGTPVMNNTFDLYSQLHFTLPGMFGNREFFKREYADPIDRDKNPVKVKALQRLTAPFILRRTKEQVAKDLPPKTESTLWCEMDTQQRWVYNELRERVKGEINDTIKKDGLQKSKLFVLQGITKLRQACNSPLLLSDEEYHIYDQSVKTTELLDELENNLSNHKALVFSQFTSMLNILSQQLQLKQIPHLMLTGATAPKERDQLVQQFNDPESKYPVFLLSLKAGNAGLNLTAADYVFLFDPWWNNAVEQQAIDRTHRIGQTKNVFAYKMICKDTIEERILSLQHNKKKLANELITEEEGFVKNLSEEDIAYLFS